jgi:molecular chaperone GrpE (heat shock protein)
MEARMKEPKKSTKGAAAVGGNRVAKAESAKAPAVEVRREPPATETRPAAAPIASAQAPDAATQGVLAELAALRRMLERLSAPPPTADAALESGVDSMRRLLTELLESRMDPVIAEVAAIRSLAASETKGKVRSVVDRLDLLLNDMGAVRFEAQRLDYFDPLIHQALAERQDANAPDRVVLETVVPGYRTCRGRVVAKAGVAINRRA